MEEREKERETECEREGKKIQFTNFKVVFNVLSDWTTQTKNRTCRSRKRIVGASELWVITGFCTQGKSVTSSRAHLSTRRDS